MSLLLKIAAIGLFSVATAIKYCSNVASLEVLVFTRAIFASMRNQVKSGVGCSIFQRSNFRLCKLRCSDSSNHSWRIIEENMAIADRPNILLHRHCKLFIQLRPALRENKLHWIMRHIFCLKMFCYVSTICASGLRVIHMYYSYEI